MKKVYTAILILCSLFSFGSHVIGGNISWKNVGQNKFVFQLKVVQKCLGPATSPITQQILHSTALGPIHVYLSGSESFTPTCEVENGMWCNSINTSDWVLITMVYTSDTLTVVGVPPASGWEFYYSFVSRPSNTVNVQVASYIDTEIYAMMYPETVTHSLSSPEFVDTYDESITPFNQFLTNPAYSNQSGDSLYYKLMSPVSGTGGPHTFNSGYQYLAPFPSYTNDPSNGAMAFNPYTGEVEVDVQVATGGYYAYTVAVEQWRMLNNGQQVMPIKVSEVRKDNLIPVMMTNTSSNSAPMVAIDTAVYKNVYQATTTAYGVKAQIGDTVRFKIQAFDADLDSNFNVQTITFDAKGAALDSSWGGWELYSSVPQLTPGFGQSSFVSAGTNTVDFEWYITPDLADSVSNAYHIFRFSFADNNCFFKGQANISLVIGIEALKDTASGVGVSEVRKSDISIFPNPANGSFSIEGLSGKSQVYLLDVQGRVVKGFSTTDSNLIVERDDLEAGIYFVKISDSNTTSLQKVLFK